LFIIFVAIGLYLRVIPSMKSGVESKSVSTKFWIIISESKRSCGGGFDIQPHRRLLSAPLPLSLDQTMPAFVSGPKPWHQGELAAQSKLGFDRFVSTAYGAIEGELDDQHATFHASLNLLPISTLDRNGRPWASLLVNQGRRDFVTSPDRNTLVARARIEKGDPLLENIKDGHQVLGYKLVGGVGVEFLNRYCCFDTVLWYCVLTPS
jgi:hypothetical protein